MLKPSRILSLLLYLPLVVGLAGCSAMLLGDGESGGRATATVDERAAAASATDRAISADVSARLDGDDLTGGNGISVSSRDGRVKLSGTVSGFEIRDRAVSITKATDGVVSVDNQIRVDTRR